MHGRLLPTNDVYFYSYKIARYPSDNLQWASIWAGTPLYIIGTTKDRVWSLVITPDPDVMVWVKSSGIARTLQNLLINGRWQQNRILWQLLALKQL